jgi:Fe-S oxidoreductase
VLEEAIWKCVTCNMCVSRCPRGIEVIDVIRAVRALMLEQGTTPEVLGGPLSSMRTDGNPWNGKREERTEWARALEVPSFTAEHDYCLFTCCTIAYDPRNKKVGRALVD